MATLVAPPDVRPITPSTPEKDPSFFTPGSALESKYNVHLKRIASITNNALKGYSPTIGIGADFLRDVIAVANGKSIIPKTGISSGVRLSVEEVALINTPQKLHSLLQKAGINVPLPLSKPDTPSLSQNISPPTPPSHSLSQGGTTLQQIQDRFNNLPNIWQDKGSHANLPLGRGSTVARSGCALIALHLASIAAGKEVPLKEVYNQMKGFIGPGGASTNISEAFAKKNDFAYYQTGSKAELEAVLRAGFSAIIHRFQDESYSGHVQLAGRVKGNTVESVDSWHQARDGSNRKNEPLAKLLRDNVYGDGRLILPKDIDINSIPPHLTRLRAFITRMQASRKA